jgi:hypothetical protein
LNMMDEESPILSDGRIVSEGNVSTALRWLAENPHPVSLAQKDVTDAKNECKRIWAEVYGEQTKGSIDDKKAAADRDPRVVAARASISEAERDLAAHQARSEAASMMIEVWRSEGARNRAAERLR